MTDAGTKPTRAPRTPRKTRPATATVLRYRHVKSARVRVAPGQNGRRSFALAVKTKEEVEARTALLAEWSERMQGLAPVESIVSILRDGGRARTEKRLAEVRKAVEVVAAGLATKKTSAFAPSFEDFAADWTSGKLQRAHPDHVRDKEHARDIQILRDYVNPVIGTTRIPDVTLEQCDEVMSSLPARLAPRSRRQVAQCVRKVLSYAVHPGRSLVTNPIPREWMPKVFKSANKAKAGLYPDEEAKVIACAAVPLERRIAYGILSREGMRASELALMKWRDVDVERGRVKLDENKTDDPRAWALSPDVVRVLRWWKERTGGEESGFVIGIAPTAAQFAGRRWNPKTRAETRHKNDNAGDLRAAGVTRAELFERTATRQPIRVHDLRALFVTVNLANGKTAEWVTDRTGHKSASMVALYKRQARTWEELNLGELRPLDTLLPEMKAASKGPSTPSTSGARRAVRRRRGSRLRSAARRRGQQTGSVVARAGIEPATRGFSGGMAA